MVEWEQPVPSLYHYTSENGLTGIIATHLLLPSLLAENPNDARYGDGQYLSDIAPGAKSPGQLAYLFLNDPRGWRRFTHFIEIDVVGLNPIEGRPGVFVICNNRPLLLVDRIVSHGRNV